MGTYHGLRRDAICMVILAETERAATECSGSVSEALRLAKLERIALMP